MGFERLIASFEWRHRAYGEIESFTLNKHLLPLPKSFNEKLVTSLVIEENRRHIVVPEISVHLANCQLDERIESATGKSIHLTEVVEHSIIGLANIYKHVHDSNVPSVADFRGYHLEELRSGFSKQQILALNLLFKFPKS